MKTSWEKAQAERHAQLAGLWQRIDCLNDKEWSRLYSLVAGILVHCSKAGLAATDLELSDLINDYFVQKILAPAQVDPAKLKAQMPEHHGALILFFKRYVISLSRKSESQLNTRSSSIETEEGELRHEVEDCGCRRPLGERLQAQGWSLPGLQQQAGAFLSGLSAIERTLIRNYCDADLSIARLFPNSPRQQSLARVAMAQMGLWSGKTRGRDLQKFAGTDLGCFMARVIGHCLENTDFDAMDALMSLLCELA